MCCRVDHQRLQRDFYFMTIFGNPNILVFNQVIRIVYLVVLPRIIYGYRCVISVVNDAEAFGV